MARFAFTPEQAELRSVLRSLLEDRASPQRVRAAIETDAGYDPALWKQLADELGVLGLAIPAEFGGAGYGYLELGVLVEEVGRALACVPLLSTVVLAAATLRLSGQAQAQADYLPRITDGTLLASLAHSDLGVAGETRPMLARRAGDGWRLDGTKLFVVDGQVADLFIVSAEVDGQTALFTVEASAHGLAREPMKTMDLTRRQARIELSDVAARMLVEPPIGARVLDEVLRQARVLLAVEQVGGAEACLTMSVEYAKLREQFGRPIGSFQAIKHRCADMLVEVELAKSTAYNALWALDEGGEDDVTLAASMAKALCSDAFVFAATENIQVHGGIGFSWEHPAHLYFRRARSSAVMFGDASFHRELIAQRLGV